MLWLKLPEPQTELQTIIECNNMLRIRLEQSILRVSLTQNASNSQSTATLTSLVTNSLNISLFRNDSQQLQFWNHLAVSFRDKRLRIHVNGIQQAEIIINNTQVQNISDYCSVGNTLILNAPFNGFIRHLVFLNQGFTTNQDITNRTKSSITPNDTTVLTYLKFGKDTHFQEHSQYYALRNLISSNVNIEYSNEAETVCYCTKPKASFLRIQNTFKLKALDMSPLNGTLDANGTTFIFQIYPIIMTSSDDSVIYSLQQYADIVLTNKSTRLRIDLYNSESQIQTRLLFSLHQFRFQFWRTYNITIRSNRVILTVDQQVIQSIDHQVTLPTRKSIKLLIQPSTITAFNHLLSYIQIQSLFMNGTASRLIFNKTFTQDELIPNFQLKNTTFGTLIFEANNQLCTLSELYNPQNFIQGNSCKSSRFGASFNNQSQSTGLTSQLRSLNQNSTIQIWIKDQSKFTSNLKQIMVIFENTVNNRTPMAQISILPGFTNDTRQIRITPNVASALNANIQMNGVYTDGQWIHLTFVSCRNQSKVFVWNHNIKKLSQNQSSFPFIQNNQFLLSSIGSSFNGTNKFLGLLREFRIWGYSMDSLEVEILRYSSAIRSFGYDTSRSQVLFHNFRLNDGLDFQDLYDTMINQTSLIPRYFVEKEQVLTSFSYQADDELVVCPHEYFYDGQCCQISNITGLVDIYLSYTQNLNKILVQIIKHPSLIQPNNTIFADFKLVEVGNNYNDSYVENNIQKLFNVNRSLGLNISTGLINPLLYSITLNARIYSIYSERVVNIQKSFQLYCPISRLSLNELANQDNNTYALSRKPNHQVKFKSEILFSQCYNKPSDNLLVYAISKVSWWNNLTTSQFTNAYDVSVDQIRLTQRLNAQNLNTTRITTRINYNEFQSQDYFMDLMYVNQSIETGVDNNNMTRNQLTHNNLTFNFSNVTIEGTGNTSQVLNISPICPLEIFKNISQYNQLCVMRGRDFILDQNQFKNLDYQLGKVYLFRFLFQIPNSYIIRPLNINVTFYKNGSNNDRCPSITYPQSYYIYDKMVEADFEIRPDASLFCYFAYFEIVSVSFSVFDEISRKTLQNIVYYDPQYPLSFFLRSTNTNIKALMGGTVLTINSTFNTRYQTFPQVLSKQINSSVTVTFKSNNIVAKINMTTFSGKNISDGNINFLEPNVTLDGLSSFDPDNATARLWFDWTCPEEITNCTEMIKGGIRNSRLVIDIWTKFMYNLAYNTSYIFTLIVWTKDNQFKANSTLDYSVRFIAPQTTDVNYAMSPTTCESLSLYNFEANPNIYYLNTTFSRVISFTRVNYTDIIFGVQTLIDNGSMLNRSPCGQANVTSRLVLYYPGNEILNSTEGPIKLIQQESPGLIPLNQKLTVYLSQIQNLFNIGPQKIYNGTVYQIIRRGTRTLINVQQIFLKRERASLMIQFNSRDLYFDKYANLVIDASNAFDAETEIPSEYTYLWTCPTPDQNCDSFNSPKMNTSADERNDLGINGVGQTFTFYVQIRDPQLWLASQNYSIQVTITQKSDYSECIKTSVSGNFDEFDSNIVKLDYYQKYNTYITMNLLVECENVNLQDPTWSSSVEQNLKFWEINDNNDYEILIRPNQVQNINPLVETALIFTQQLRMGSSSKVYLYQSYVYLEINPPQIVAKPSGQFIYIDGQDEFIQLNATQSYDPLNKSFSCYWICPALISQKYCFTTSCSFQISLMQLKDEMGQDTYNQLLNFSHLFQLSIATDDFKRVSTAPWSIYLSDGIQFPYNTSQIRNCSINQINNNGNFIIERFNQFKFECNYENGTLNLTRLWELYNWTVDGLTFNAGYTVQDNVLTIQPYASTLIKDIYVYINVQPNYLGNQIIGQNMFSLQNQLRIEIPFKQNIAIDGLIDITSNAQNPNFYTTNFTFIFSDFNYDSSIYIQLRIQNDKLKDQNVLIPLKSFTQVNIQRDSNIQRLLQFTNIDVDA
ncbi:UNKNOWN [Stylonychia lemnae]|uniref:Uncharacterized protein n=1 Tax=Stylonychia lemnae TaxID=5949 RepID=A0A078A4Z6_STYLE|nr:UNKNOWN [Stylonychia lemnae]|eukprot:CDW76645.1 UNKNOWN [Stylonychia lemnae]